MYVGRCSIKLTINSGKCSNGAEREEKIDECFSIVENGDSDDKEEMCKYAYKNYYLSLDLSANHTAYIRCYEVSFLIIKRRQKNDDRSFMLVEQTDDVEYDFRL